MTSPSSFSLSLVCPDCPRRFRNQSGLTQHRNSKHRNITPLSDEDDETDSFVYRRHPYLTAQPCAENGADLPPYTAPPPPPDQPIDGRDPDAWAPFYDRLSFDFAHYHFVEVQSSEAKINTALELWAASIVGAGGKGDDMPWSNAQELYSTIDAIQHSHAPWKVYEIRYQGPMPDGVVPPKWMTETYELCARDTRRLLHLQLANTDFKDKISYVPYQQFNGQGDRVWSNLMSADWAWKQADIIARDPAMHGTMFVPVIAGSDKTTVSVATGHQEYHPVYQSPGNITNVARRGHGMGVLPCAFLPIPKTSQQYRSKPVYKQFCRQLYHACLAKVFDPLKAGMTTPELVRCPDGHLRRAVYGLGPYIADYPEQVWLAGIVQNWCDAHPENLDAPGAHLRSHQKTEFLLATFDPGILWDDYGIRSDVAPFTTDFPRADIHELLSPDLLHQVIKGTFKDHLVSWVSDYLVQTHGERQALPIIQDIDRRISAVPAFPGLRRFPDGRDFNQWTGDDSKALMKVYLAAIVGHVPSAMVKCFSAFLDFCYIARQNAIVPADLIKLDDTLTRFHHYRAVFIETGVRITISLPRQHSLKHYLRSIRLFGSPNGLCSSITESKHIKAVKEPWRRSSRYKALAQMLGSISRLDKMDAARRDFTRRGMMEGSTSSYTSMILNGGTATPREIVEEEGHDNDDLGPVAGPKVLSSISLARIPELGYPHDVEGLAAFIGQPRFPTLLRRFLWEQTNPNAAEFPADVPLEDCPHFGGRISIYHSAVARFFAPSDMCGAGGMRHERIRSNPNWHGAYPRYDTVFVETNGDLPGMLGMVIGRVLLFFSFSFRGTYYPCALVSWLVPVGNRPDEDTGLWVVQPEYEGNGRRSLAVIHLDCVARGAHLLPIYGSLLLPEDFHYSAALDAFRSFFVNKFADHHSFEFIP